MLGGTGKLPGGYYIRLVTNAVIKLEPCWSHALRNKLARKLILENGGSDSNRKSDVQSTKESGYLLSPEGFKAGTLIADYLIEI